MALLKCSKFQESVKIILDLCVYMYLPVLPRKRAVINFRCRVTSP